VENKIRKLTPQHSFFLTALAIPSVSMLLGCGPSIEDLEAVDYTPVKRNDWEVSTPEMEGLDPMLVAETYYNASKLETIYSLLIIRNGRLIAGQITDPRKKRITIRNMLQMRAGYPREETDPALWEALWTGEYLNDIVNIPLTADPGTAFQYSNLTSQWLGIIAARAIQVRTLRHSVRSTFFHRSA
jgi:hypothetical protein